ncbi:MAG: hypothetical protein COA50_12725 [Flavobacteriaceae bacterium]|nr:MAG: hypothetical protein COA50_12725 [Flavobacteriaceae bacterium]
MRGKHKLYNKRIALKFGFKKANRFLPHIILVGLGIGTANLVIDGGLNWIQWVIQSLSTSLLIGYTTVLIGSNKPWFKVCLKPIWKLYVLIFLVFLFVGVFATEMEHIIRSLVFRSEPYLPFTAGKMYLFNGIISLFLGFSFFQNSYLSKIRNSNSIYNTTELQNQEQNTKESLKPSDFATSIPVKQGENILLIPIRDIVYFEAYDNYSFVYDLKAQKRLCDYSLLFLEKRLDEKFSRVHRKYIVNARHIKLIKPHLNSRYLIEFSQKELLPITSSKSYSKVIRKLIKME